eukprot:5042251-Amphidinium_carterae.1
MRSSEDFPRMVQPLFKHNGSRGHCMEYFFLVGWPDTVKLQHALFQEQVLQETRRLESLPVFEADSSHLTHWGILLRGGPLDRLQHSGSLANDQWSAGHKSLKRVYQDDV